MEESNVFLELRIQEYEKKAVNIQKFRSSYASEISVARAREIAAFTQFDDQPLSTPRRLTEETTEAECCWLFYQFDDKPIILGATTDLTDMFSDNVLKSVDLVGSCYWIIAVSKKGKLSEIRYGCDVNCTYKDRYAHFFSLWFFVRNQ